MEQILLERTSTFRPRRVSAIVDQSIIKSRFDEECTKLVVQRQEAKLQWLQDPCEAKKDNLSNIRREARKHFRNKKTKYLGKKELEINSKNKASETCIRT
jgi:hypothetical protein